MSGMQRFKKTGVLFLASLLMTTAQLTLLTPAYADDNTNPLPEVEVDSSVLQQLDSSIGRTHSLMPIQLVPLPSLNRKTSTLAAPSLTKDEAEDARPAFVQAPQGMHPIITGNPSAQASVTVPPVEGEAQNQQRRNSDYKSNENPRAMPSVNAGVVSNKPDLANEDRPSVIKPKIIAAEISTPPGEPSAIEKIVTSITSEPSKAPIPHAAPAQPVVAENKHTAKKGSASKIAAAHPKDNQINPPKTMKEAEGIKAPNGRMVMFPVQSTIKTKGEMDPAMKAAAATPLTPKTAVTASTDPAPSAPSKQSPPSEDIAKQDTPDILYKNVPVPRPRPNIAMASNDFVEKARRTFEDTYTIVKRDGDKMPAIPKTGVQSEKLPPSHLSVADIASDPLASKLVAMSPNDIASALNKMAPAAGDDNRHMGSDIKIVTHRPRIVRENGDWTPRKERVVPTPVIDTAAVPVIPADGRYLINFKSTDTDLPSASFGDVDNGIIAALKSNSTARVQIVAYASSADGKEATARRTSLSRALSLRSYLITKGIDATRMDVRAMGVQQDAKATPDQVQMIMVPADESKKL